MDEQYVRGRPGGFELDEVVDRLPSSWVTRVGEAGAQPARRERQRVSIARAFLKTRRSCRSTRQVAETWPPAGLRKTGGIFARLLEQYEHARTWHLSARL
ncbi:hypothetical protein [Amycolatopsis magusensis]|uniref:hypothetical protein n=1 Tax=Amycolatopsis magusensis TaxID=882444 RepID=UPI003C2BF880